MGLSLFPGSSSLSHPNPPAQVGLVSGSTFSVQVEGTSKWFCPAIKGMKPPQWLSGKESGCSAGATGDMGSIPRSGRFPGRGRGNPLQYSCLENPMDRGAWQATVHRVTKSRTQLKPLSTQATIKGIETLLKYSRFWFCLASEILPDAVT